MLEFENMISADLSATIIHTVYGTFSHNYVLFSYLLGFLVSTVLVIFRPSRFSFLLVLGFLILAFSFEYDKHIAAGLREQTLEALMHDRTYYRTQKIVSLFISEVLPMFLYLLGWVLVYIALVIGGMKEGN